jgi:hypothetical protein
MINKCLIYGNLNICNLFEINGIIRYYSNIYDEIYVVCKNNYYNSACNIFLDNKKIIILSLDIQDEIINNDHYIFDYYKNNIINLILDNSNDKHYHIGKNYYNKANLDYSLRYRYEKINRNHIFENKFYEKIMKKYNNNYIFINDYTSYNYKKINIYSKLPIYHPKINYYEDDKYSNFYDYWNNESSDNILDYCKILENAYEIHLAYNEFFCLANFLNLYNVKNKYIYTDIVNIKDYYENLKDWKIIYVA